MVCKRKLPHNSPRQVLLDSIRYCGCRSQYKKIKSYWSNIDDFLLALSRYLLDIVPDDISGTCLFHTCLTNGIRSTCDLVNEGKPCQNDNCIIDCFISRTIDPIPRLLCLTVTCNTSGTVWNPLEETLEEWLKMHPLYTIQPSNLLFSSDDAERFRLQFREQVIDFSSTRCVADGICVKPYPKQVE
ncbi:hypothetical protein [Thiolapillus sp.]|uniref:hypothetical protein n=4 Tax=Thiolapillus sp. TaxID=2017437 RepID=UPI003AF95753